MWQHVYVYIYISMYVIHTIYVDIYIYIYTSVCSWNTFYIFTFQNTSMIYKYIPLKRSFSPFLPGLSSLKASRATGSRAASSTAARRAPSPSPRVRHPPRAATQPRRTPARRPQARNGGGGVGGRMQPLRMGNPMEVVFGLGEIYCDLNRRGVSSWVLQWSVVRHSEGHGGQGHPTYPRAHRALRWTSRGLGGVPGRLCEAGVSVRQVVGVFQKNGWFPC